ncbi:MAG TPA: hypothetical protein VGQ83_12815 [Polyangia bacterium]
MLVRTAAALAFLIVACGWMTTPRARGQRATAGATGIAGSRAVRAVAAAPPLAPRRSLQMRPAEPALTQPLEAAPRATAFPLLPRFVEAWTAARPSSLPGVLSFSGLDLQAVLDQRPWMPESVVRTVIEATLTLSLSAVAKSFASQTGREEMAQGCGIVMTGCSPTSMRPNPTREIISDVLYGVATLGALATVYAWYVHKSEPDAPDWQLRLRPFAAGAKVLLRW